MRNSHKRHPQVSATAGHIQFEVAPRCDVTVSDDGKGTFKIIIDVAGRQAVVRDKISPKDNIKSDLPDWLDKCMRAMRDVQTDEAKQVADRAMSTRRGSRFVDPSVVRFEHQEAIENYLREQPDWRVRIALLRNESAVVKKILKFTAKFMADMETSSMKNSTVTAAVKAVVAGVEDVTQKQSAKMLGKRTARMELATKVPDSFTLSGGAAYVLITHLVTEYDIDFPNRSSANFKKGLGALAVVLQKLVRAGGKDAYELADQMFKMRFGDAWGEEWCKQFWDDEAGILDFSYYGSGLKWNPSDYV